MDEFDIARIVHAAIDLAEPLVDIGNFFPVERPEVVRNENYYEETIPSYSDIQFREHFRMSRETFEVLLGQLQQFLVNEIAQVPLRKKLLFTLWTISKQDSFLSVGDRFGFAKSTAHLIFFEIVQYLGRLSYTYIRWQNLEQHVQTANIFQNRSNGFPGVIGAIDGCHIQIKQPEGNAFDYYNRKGVNSVILQGVCDDKGIFTDVCIGMPGRMHDSRVYRLSPLYNRIDELIPNNFHMIGDLAYPLSVKLMKPYQDNGHLTREQRTYNIKLSSIRSIIERAFGLLKGKFRRLKYLDVSTPENASKIIMAACVLHNFILLQGNPRDEYLLGEVNGENEEGGGNNVNNEPIIQVAENKRRGIVNLCAL